MLTNPLLSEIEKIVQINDEEKSIILDLFQLKEFKSGDFFLKKMKSVRMLDLLKRGLFVTS